MSLHNLVKLEILITQVLPLRCHTKKLQNLSHLNYHWPLNSPDLKPVDYSVLGILQEKVYKTCITDMDELKQRLKMQWTMPFVSGVVDSCTNIAREVYKTCITELQQLQISDAGFVHLPCNISHTHLSTGFRSGELASYS